MSHTKLAVSVSSDLKAIANSITSRSDSNSLEQRKAKVQRKKYPVNGLSQGTVKSFFNEGYGFIDIDNTYRDRCQSNTMYFHLAYYRPVVPILFNDGSVGYYLTDLPARKYTPFDGSGIASVSVMASIFGYKTKPTRIRFASKMVSVIDHRTRQRQFKRLAHAWCLESEISEMTMQVDSMISAGNYSEVEDFVSQRQADVEHYLQTVAAACQ